jgi:hypothetical protein
MALRTATPKEVTPTQLLPASTPNADPHGNPYTTPRDVTSALLGWGTSGANRTCVDRLEPDWCGADQTWYGGSQRRRPAG